jgi:2-phosphosulfolactate phosphatase
MVIDVVLNNNFSPKSKHIDISNYVCGVIDVIRATTTMSVMIAKGCSEIIIAKNKTQAFLIKKLFKNYLLCGEEGGHPPEGFDFGNSPLEYSAMNLKGKGIILKTTNGTKSFFKTLCSKGSFVLSIVNISFTCDVLINEAQKNNSDILLICSGEKGKIAFDDAYTAGMAVKIIKEKIKNIDLTDGASLVLNNAEYEKNPLEALKKSVSYRSMIKAGLGEDVNICSMPDLYNTTGYLNKYDCSKLKIISNNNIKKSYINPNIFVIKPLICHGDV